FYQLQAINLVMKVAECAVYDVSKEKAESLAVIASRRLNLNVRVCASPEEAVRESDVVVTVTPSSSPIVKNEWVTDGMHLNCVGADAPGKQELETGILKRARIIIDDWEQASHSGEINVSVTQGVITRSDVIGEIGDIIAGSLQGRTRDNEITLFDTTGLAIQDVVCAWKAYEMAERKGLGVLMDSLGK
ncbi:ornithine cyclodeaminase family protein, partial [Candidatus Bipolaricaulota bacterium]|nr:ornithine cyclodeaminase family protein [Candidatus Bipolaricaulota bacterium]